VAIVGKGITFDSGGLSIKTGKGMEDMKADMSGAAAALHIMKAVSALTSISPLEHELHVLVPTCENMINGRATRPGDIVYAMNGKSIEILNTDAEGRLILADALSYAERLHPEIVIDIATLTGACIVALGDEYAGLFSNTPALQESIVTLGERCGERYWPLPLAPEYRASIDSPVAHLKNIAASGPGAIVAALFLKEFVPQGAAWAHLDIAGPAYQTRATEVLSHGGTGFSITTLLHLLYSAELGEITAHEDS
jgi:leucyl aminopeptidase